MKRSVLALFAVSACVIAEAAAPVVTQCAARQRWPWSQKVDIDFWLTSDTCADVEFSATYDGALAPISLGAGLDESPLSLKPGLNHLTWDPVKAGLGSQKLTGFTIVPTVATFDARKYLVLDLQTGDYEYASEPPAEGGWTADVYKSSKMVFRRVPAGVYEVGNTSEELTKFDVSTLPEVMARRTVKITSDYYMAIFIMTAAQQNALNGRTPGTGFGYGKTSYEGLRGKITNGTDSVIWPQTGYKVAEGSFIKKFRDKMKLPKGMIIDLPTETQWEVAALARRTTIFPAGGTVDDTVEDLLDYLNVTSVTVGNGTVGTKEPNGWGLYDTTGIFWEFALEGYNDSSSSDKGVTNPDFRDSAQTVDPIGRECTADETFKAITCNSGYISNPTKLTATMLPSYRVARLANIENVATRFCIHLQPLVK